MTDFILSTSSTVDIDKKLLDKEDIKWIAYNYQIDDKEYKEDFGKTISFNKFYKKMINGSITRTSQISYRSYMEYFESFLREDLDIIHLCLSSGISGGYNQALMAKNDLEEKYPDRKIYVIDSLTATSCQSLLLLAMNEQKKARKTIDQIYDWAIKNRLHTHAWFFTSDLTYLVRGGRLSKFKGSFGNLLNICPLIEVNAEGKLILRKKIRTKKKAVKSLLSKIEELRVEDPSYSNDILIVHTHNIDEAKELKVLIKETFPDFTGEIKIYEIGATIGAHLGPGALGVCFWGKEKIV